MRFDIDRGIKGKRVTYYEAERYFKDLTSNADYFHSQITHHIVAYIKEYYLVYPSDINTHNALNSFVMNKRFLGYLIF